MRELRVLARHIIFLGLHLRVQQKMLVGIFQYKFEYALILAKNKTEKQQKTCQKRWQVNGRPFGENVNGLIF